MPQAIHTKAVNDRKIEESHMLKKTVEDTKPVSNKEIPEKHLYAIRKFLCVDEMFEKNKNTSEYTVAHTSLSLKNNVEAIFQKKHEYLKSNKVKL